VLARGGPAPLRLYTLLILSPYSRGGIKAQRVYCKALYKNISAGRYYLCTRPRNQFLIHTQDVLSEAVLRRWKRSPCPFCWPAVGFCRGSTWSRSPTSFL